jgi:hypothetical protein
MAKGVPVRSMRASPLSLASQLMATPKGISLTASLPLCRSPPLDCAKR